MKKLVFSVLVFALFDLKSYAHSVDHKANPQYQFAINDNQSGLTDGDVQLLFSILDEMYRTSINNTSKSWTSGYAWEKPFLGAGSTFSEGNFSVMLWGGLVRARGMNFGSLSAILCHELGHRLAGPPFQKFPGSDPDWSSAEGQADYFAATACLPAVYQSLMEKYPSTLKTTLEENFSLSLCGPSKNEEQCRWVSQAGVDMIEVLQIYYERDKPLAYPSASAKEVVPVTLFTAYPTAQCRMDIYKDAATDGLKPRLPCWFRNL